MTKKQLLIASGIADSLDLIAVGQIPGLSWFVDIPVLLIHVAFAGPKGWITVLELVPLVGTIPIFTLAALQYEDKT